MVLKVNFNIHVLNNVKSYQISLNKKDRLIPKVRSINTSLNYDLEVLKKLMLTSSVRHF
jgi:hypothetical protein